MRDKKKERGRESESMTERERERERERESKRLTAWQKEGLTNGLTLKKLRFGPKFWKVFFWNHSV